MVDGEPEDDGRTRVPAGLVQTARKTKMMAGSSLACCRLVGSTRKPEAQVRLPREMLLLQRQPGQGEAVDIDDEQEARRRRPCSLSWMESCGWSPDGRLDGAGGEDRRTARASMGVKDEAVSWLLHALAWPW
ncbi:hypothetical protein PVAP13_5KG750801 [Panicum virgatum]|uniref:Uncharacterized protein n=1 Tax=Panicum virgatum TaxID=38727 RepID=A0A8T0T0L8_PANVG|nr:hypothetical protein PVAP13_5KG750801 [Panicum virgatum]